VKYISVPEDPLPNREWTICLFLFALQPFFLDRMKRMRDLAACDRPREKIARKGAQALSDHELIAAIIGHGTPNRDVFSLAKDIVGLFSRKSGAITYDDLVGLPGIGKARHRRFSPLSNWHAGTSG